MNAYAHEDSHSVDLEEDQEILCPNCDGELVFFFCRFARCADCKADYLVTRTLGIEQLVRRFSPLRFR